MREGINKIPLLEDLNSMADVVYEAPNIYLLTKRLAYQRGELAQLQVLITGLDKLGTPSVELQVDDWVAEIPVESGGLYRVISFDLDTNRWKVGTYECQLSLLQDGSVFSSGSFQLIIAKPHRSPGIPVYLWGGAGNNEQLHFYADMGFDHLFTGIGDVNGIEKWRLFDEALRIGVRLGARPSTFNILEDEEPELQIKSANGEHIEHLCQFEPEVRERTVRKIGKIMGSLGTHPAFTSIFPNTEREDRLQLCRSDRCVDIHEAHTGFDTPPEAQEPKWITPGVIADDDMKYISTRYYWQYGDGWPVGNQTVAHTALSHDPGVLVWSDPFRKCAVYHRFRGMGAISTWTYTNPDPKYMLFIETLVAAAKPENQKVIHTVTLWNYGGTLVPSEDRRENVIAMGPDRLVETCWINLSRRPDGLCVYMSSRLDPFKNKDPFASPPETYQAFKEFIEGVVRPYGPMISKLKRVPRKVAVLDSIASRVYPSESARGYANTRIYNLYTVLQMAHIPADVIFDETIERYGLDDYDILVLPECPTLTESVYRRIRLFMANGGTVVADENLGADLPGAIRVDFNFSYRSRVTANMITANKDFEIQDDLIGRRDWGITEGRGVTAMEDQVMMESYAQELRSLLDGKVERQVDASVPTVILNLLEYDEVSYLFIVNDKRTYGERVGKWKAMLEKGVAQNVTIKWKIKGRVPILYDLIRGERVQIDQISPEEITFEIPLPPAGGSIIASYPRTFKRICIKAPSKLHKGTFDRVSISILDERGLNVPGVQPVHLELLDAEGNLTEWSGYYTAERGQIHLDILPADNEVSGTWKLNVTELGTGLKAQVEMVLI
jgi:hypothetical protein